ncbi:transglycosylase SLT domain-containing protein [Kamptonema sp. UHCC 0994]|uniref:lytic transglycosylase domain-containing protein n=1 Tax=Kamptonema sp. UHCC 0994 TaxID=3031329 RepID=UPI0023BA00FB|nr:transglycosylase SLT domain-containing protein [Kamptonema sp. UHCC 0994]MDF0551615.1 transglycosylase SLT domain-containing protein [Kamptonema sp. UHCC 0994]
MLKQRKTAVPLLIGVSVCALAIGAFAPITKWIGFGSSANLKPQDTAIAEAEVRTLVSLSPIERSQKLEAIAQQPQSRARSEARYLLAKDLMAKGEAAQALTLLENLEQDYPILSSHIVMLRAQAYEAAGEAGKAENTWQDLLKRYGNDPVAAEALYTLGKTRPEYWDKAIAEFPSHPRTVEMARSRLKANPNQPELLLLIAKHGLYLKDYGSIVETLAQKYSAFLKPEDWEAIAFGYWEKQDYGKAAIAYAKSPRTPRNLYRKARGLWLDGKIPESKIAYKQLITEFPDGGEDTALGLIRISRLSDPKEALIYLDRAISKFPDRAPEALLDKSKILDKQGSEKSASQTRQLLLQKYNNSDAAAELRWTIAQQAAKAGDLKIAWQQARDITNNNPESILAPEAAFWVGKWAQRIGRQEDAQKAFEYTIARYPESYFAWRSAVFLGWPVGDFTTVRSLSPNVVPLAQRPEPPAGSEALKELYQLGQDRSAWTLWQVEFKNQMKPSIPEQFTDGLMRIGVGDNLDGLWMISSLRQREEPEDKNQYLSLRQQPAYWQSLYPFPYLETIVKWSGEMRLNPVLVTALIRQESRFMPGIKSAVGATGLMQVMPETGDWIAKQIQLKNYSLENVDDNIKLGTWYLDHTHDEYKNNSMLAVASYNAGPGAVGDWLQRFGFNDPDAFVDKIPYDETKGYVKSVFENYWNYLRIYNPEINQLMMQHNSAQQQPAKP